MKISFIFVLLIVSKCLFNHNSFTILRINVRIFKHVTSNIAFKCFFFHNLFTLLRINVTTMKHVTFNKLKFIYKTFFWQRICVTKLYFYVRLRFIRLRILIVLPFLLSTYFLQIHVYVYVGTTGKIITLHNNLYYFIHIR